MNNIERPTSEGAILYIRVSTKGQARKGYSAAQQLEALREHAAREGYMVLEKVTDLGESGTSLERPGMDRVRDLVATGIVSVVAIQDLDRLAREPAHYQLLRHEFGMKGCRLECLDDRGLAADQFVRYEWTKVAERSQRGKLRKAREGKIVGGPSLTMDSNSTTRGMATRWMRARYW